MKLKYLLFSFAVVAFLATSDAVEVVEKIEESTKSPIEKQLQVSDSELKTTTDKPPTSTSSEQTTKNKSEAPQSPTHTVADFIIHPLIALKPRTPEDDMPNGKQAPTTSSSPWSIFGFSPGQSFGSLAGSVSGWISDRIPGLVDTPVRAAITATTLRPEGVPHPTNSPNRQRPNHLDYNEEQEVDNYDDDDDDFEYEEDDGGEELVSPSRTRIIPNFGDPNNLENNDDEETIDEYEDEDSDNDFIPQVVQRPDNRLRPGQNIQNIAEQQQRRLSNLQRQQMLANKRHLQQVNQFQYDDDDDDDDDDVDNPAKNLFYNGNPSMKRSQNEIGFFQRGQQNLLNNFGQLSRSQGSRRPQEDANHRRKHTTRLPNGNVLNVAPEVANKAEFIFSILNSQLITPQQVKKRVRPSIFQQPNQQSKPNAKPHANSQIKLQSRPLSAQPALKKKDQPVQYIAIPWSQLSKTPTTGLKTSGFSSQLKPIILNIPQSAIDQIQKGTILTEDSLLNLVKPARVQPSRTNAIATKKPNQKKPNVLSMMNAPHRRVRPSTTMEKNPAEVSTFNNTDESGNDSDSEELDGSKLRNRLVSNTESEYIVIGDDDEPGLIRQVQPVHGNERILEAGIRPYFGPLTRQQQKAGRVLEDLAEAAANHEEIEQKIAVEIVYEDKIPKSQSPQSVPSESKES